MINIIIFSIISTFLIVAFLYLDNSKEDEYIEMEKFFKYFFIILIINFIIMFIFSKFTNKSYLNIPVEIGLLD